MMGKLKHDYNAFRKVPSKFFHKKCVFWSFPQSFNEFRHKLHILKISGTILEQLTRSKKLQEEVSPTKLFQI